mmetsp:Transcript_62257/g.178634  ORF Transcript_62257/g.178634 Transcript_62257/m.178634 type:complete len:94 (+) Transcript_62257:94-375(+)
MRPRYAHPEVDKHVFAVQREFSREAKRQSKDDFDEEHASEDFRLHDVNNDQRPSTKEFGDLLGGHELLTESINQALEAADGDGDGHLHLICTA